MITAQEAKNLIQNELSVLIKKDENIKKLLVDILKPEFASKQQTEDRFEILLEEYRKEKAEQNKKWEAFQKIQDEKWEAFQKKQDEKWETFQKKQDEKWETFQKKEDEKWKTFQKKQDEKWESFQKIQDKKWEKFDKFQEEQDKKWEENRKEFDRLNEKIDTNAKKVDRSIGALGTRWGMQSERSFRNALAGILENSFDVKVLNINEYDEKGEVFGHPDQIEIDIIVKNGLLIICELKSSMSKPDIYIFERKIRFYEKKNNKKANRRIIISPMIKPQTIDIAKKFNIEVFNDSLDVEKL